MKEPALVYFRGERSPEGGIVSRDEALVSPNDRGFLFGDGVYEFVRSYRGRLFRVKEHLARLRHSLDAVRIEFGDISALERIALELLRRNGLGESDATVYVQITRGTSPRTLVVAGQLLPTVYAEVNPCVGGTDSGRGAATITVPDIRWHRCDIKSVGLLPNVLARMQATEAGADEAVFVRDGVVTEGTHTNLFGVLSGAVVTHAADNHVLAGITRSVVLDLCRALGIPVAETGIREDQLLSLEELFLSATTAEVTPVVRVNGGPVSTGRPGPITLRLQSAFREYILGERGLENLQRPRAGSQDAG